MPPNVSVSALVKFPGVVGLRGRRGLVWCPVETIICVFAFTVTQEPNECSVFVVYWHQNIPKHSTNREQNYTTPNLTTDLFINVPVLFVVLTRMGSSPWDSPLFRRLVLGHPSLKRPTGCFYPLTRSASVLLSAATNHSQQHTNNNSTGGILCLHVRSSLATTKWSLCSRVTPLVWVCQKNFRPRSLPQFHPIGKSFDELR